MENLVDLIYLTHMQKIIKDLTAMKNTFNHILVGMIISSAIFGCSSSDEGKKIIPPATRQAPDEPVYGTTFLSRPPHPVPESQEVIRPKSIVASGEEISISATNKYVEDIVKEISEKSGYRPYVSAFIAKKRISITSSDDLEGTCAKVANEAKASVSVDHIAKEIRFMAGVSPKL